MNQKGRLNVEPEQVERLIAVQFPEFGHLPIRPVDASGWDNFTFHLGEKMSVRLPSAPWYVEQVAKEQQWLPRLAASLPFVIPVPLRLGQPGEGYPYPWSIYDWIEGDNASNSTVGNFTEFATTVGKFLLALHQVDASDGPPAGAHCFFRGGSLAVYDTETRDAIEALNGEIKAVQANEVWDTALASSWSSAPVWVHGDFASGNILVRDGRLCAVIDFGCACVGDPACDLVISWTFLAGESREAFRRTVEMDKDTWARARGWALWKALITLVPQCGKHSEAEKETRRVIDDILNDHRAFG